MCRELIGIYAVFPKRIPNQLLNIITKLDNSRFEKGQRLLGEQVTRRISQVLGDRDDGTTNMCGEGISYVIRLVDSPEGICIIID